MIKINKLFSDLLNEEILKTNSSEVESLHNSKGLENRIPNVTNNTTNIIINNLTYINENKNDVKTSLSLEQQIKIINSTNIHNEKPLLDISHNNSHVNTEIIEKIQNEIKHLESLDINTINNQKNTTHENIPLIIINKNPNENSSNVKNISEINNNNNLLIPNNLNLKNNTTINSTIKEIPPIDANLQNKKKEINNKNIERYIKKKVSPYSTDVTNTSSSYNSEKNNLIKENKFIQNKIASRKIPQKNPFFNTSMSFDQNNDNKNSTFDNELVKRLEKDTEPDKSEEKNIINSLKVNLVKKISNNENYIIKKSVNKKFDTIREEDEENINKKKLSNLNYYKPHVITEYKNIITTENNNNNLIKKNIKKNYNDTSFFDQYISNKKQNPFMSTPKKNSVSPGIKNIGANSSRYNQTNNTTMNNYVISENNSTSVSKSTKNNITKTQILTNNPGKKIRQKNISMPNTEKFTTITETKQIGNNNLNFTTSGNNYKSPIKKPPISSTIVSRHESVNTKNRNINGVVNSNKINLTNNTEDDVNSKKINKRGSSLVNNNIIINNNYVNGNNQMTIINPRYNAEGIINFLNKIQKLGKV